jgi:orotate phosphoribosyltransferase
MSGTSLWPTERPWDIVLGQSGGAARNPGHHDGVIALARPAPDPTGETGNATATGELCTGTPWAATRHRMDKATGDTPGGCARNLAARAARSPESGPADTTTWRSPAPPWPLAPGCAPGRGGPPCELRDSDPVTSSDLARQIRAASHLTGEFVLRSGRTATEYFDKYRFEADPVLLDAIAQAMARLVPPGTEVLAGLEMGGIPVVTALGRHTGLPCAFVRKQAKSYGTRRLAEGADLVGRRVLVVEDVVTSGGQIILSAAELRALGADVREALCVIDRQEGGAEALAGERIGLLSLLTAADLSAAL